MKTILKSGLTLLLALTMLIPVLASCNGNKTPANTPTGTNANSGNGVTTNEPTTNGGEEEEVEVLPDTTYGNRDINILIRKNDTYYRDMEIDEDEIKQGKANQVDEQVYYRNRAVEKRLGVNLNFIKDDASGEALSAETVRNAIGDGKIDLIADHGRSAFTYAVEGSLKNWYDLKYVDLTKSWWSQGMISDFTIRDTLWCMSGDLSYLNTGATVVMVMNKNLRSELNLDDPYEAVLNETWTFEKFNEMVKEAGTDNGTTESDPEKGDQTGYMTSLWRGPMTALFSAGLRTVKVGEDGNLQMTVNSDKTILLFKDYFDLLGQKNVKFYPNGKPANFEKTFANGNVLFIDTRLYDVNKIIQNGFMDYGILPWPKYDEDADEYYAWVDACANTFGVLTGKSEEDYECISAVLEALAAEGHRRVIPAFYEDTVQAKYAQDPESYEALELIRAGRVFDLGTFMETDLGDLSRVGPIVSQTSNRSYSEWWEKNKTGLQGKVDKLNEKLGKITGTK